MSHQPFVDASNNGAVATYDKHALPKAAVSATPAFVAIALKVCAKNFGLVAEEAVGRRDEAGAEGVGRGLGVLLR